MAAFFQWLVRRSNPTVLTSATFWVNLLTIGATLLTYISGVLPPEYLPWATLAAGVINAVLVVLKKMQPAPVPGPNVPEPSPATDLMELVRKVIEAIIAKKVPASEAKPLLLAKVAAAVDEAEAFDKTDANDLIKELKA